ncbi:MAG: O-antigen ligase family protein [Verrucomicrobia bacterium]|nr:O-antigen ligase family protein [Verrucomicrobiota bacterium]
MTTTTERRHRRRRSLDEVATAPGWRGGVEVFCERAVFYILCFMLLFAPLAFGTVRPWSRDPLHLLTLLALLCWAARVAAAGRISWTRTPLDLPIAAGVVYVVARYAASPVEWESRQEMLLVLMYAAVYFLATQHLFRRQRLTVVLWLLVAVAIGISAYAIINKIRGVEMCWWLPNKDYGGRSYGTFYCPNHFAGYLELVLAVAGAQLLWSGRSAAQRIVLAYGVAVMMGGIALSLSRGGYLSTGAMVLFLVIVVSRGVSKQWWPGIALAVTLAVSGVVTVSSFDSIRKRFDALELAGDRVPAPNQPLQVGEPSRWWMWIGAAKMFADHPWFGVGPFLFNTCYGPYRVPEDQCVPEHVHNDYLQMLTDYGIVGFVLMGVLVVVFFVSAWRIHQRWRQLGRPDEPRWHWPFWLDLDRGGRPAWLLGSAAAVICYMVHSVVDFNLHITSNAMTLTVLMAAGMLADCSRRLSATAEGEGVTLPPVVKVIELGPAARWLAPCAVLLFVAGVAVIAIPNYGGYLLMRLAEKRYAVEKPGSEAADVILPPGQLTEQRAMKLEDAVRHAERSWRWDPLNFQVARLLGDVKLAQARMSYKEGDALARQALRWYQQAEALNPFQAEFATRRADTLEFLGRWKEAEAARQHAVKLDPNCYLYSRYLATFHLLRGRRDVAVEWFQKAVKIYPGDRVSRRKLEQLGAPSEAVRPPSQKRSDPAVVLRELLAPLPKSPPAPGQPAPKRDTGQLLRQLEKLDTTARTNPPAPRTGAQAPRSDPAVVLRELLAPLPKPPAAPGQPARPQTPAPKRDSSELLRQLEKIDAMPRTNAPTQRSDPSKVLRELLAPAPAPKSTPPAPPAPPPQAQRPVPPAAQTPAGPTPAIRDLIAPLASSKSQFKPIQTPLQKPLQQPIPPPPPTEPPKPSREALIQQLDAIAAQPRTNAPASRVDTNKVNQILAPFIRRH